MMLQWVQRKPLRSSTALVLSTLIILLGGGVTLLWQIHQGQSSHADGGNVVGPPTLSAATVDKIFASVGSPMAGTGKIVEQAARQANVDDAFALAVWWVETNDGMAGVGLNNRNPGAVQGTNGYIFYPSYADAVTDWFTVLRSRYISRGLTSVYTICYPYVGTSSSLQWANKVVTYMQRYQGEAPPPTPTPGHAPVNLQVVPADNPVTARSNPDKRQMLNPTATAATQPITSTIPTLTTQPALSMPNQLLLVIGGLLAALALLVVGLGVRRRGAMTPAATPVTEALEPAVALPPLYVNEYSPIAETASASWWEQQAQEAQPVAAFAARQYSSFVAEPVSVINGVPQLSFDEPPVAQSQWNGGAPGTLRARRLIRASSSSLDQEQHGERSTEELMPFYRPGLSLPGRMLEPATVEATENSQQERILELVSAGVGSAQTRGGGLLRRYSMQQVSEDGLS